MSKLRFRETKKPEHHYMKSVKMFFFKRKNIWWYLCCEIKYINTILESPFSMLFNDSEHISLIVRYCRKVALDSVRWSKANMRNQGLLFSASSLSHWMSSEKHLKPDFSLLREKEVEQLWDLSNKGFLKIKQCGFQVPGIKIARNKSSLKK